MNRQFLVKRGHIDFFINEFSVGNTIKVSSNYDARDYKKITVGTITLDDYCNDLSIMPTIIKIDVEGGEEDVITGAQKILAKSSPLIAMEVWRSDNQSHKNAFYMFINLGFVPYWINEEGNLLKIFSDFSKINFENCFKNSGLQVYDNLLFKK